MNYCVNCNEPINGNYCSNCGHSAKLKRIDWHYVTHELAETFNIKRGMLYTIKRMLLSPGESVKEYITEDRSLYVKPITFLILTALFYTLVNQFFHIGIHDYYYPAQSEVLNGSTAFIGNWMLENSGYTTIFMGFFIAFCIKLFFRKSDYNLFEIFVLLCFVSGMSFLLISVVTIFQLVVDFNLLGISSFISIVYFIWATGQFFDKKKVTSYIKAALSYILAVIILGYLVECVGTLIDIVKF